VTNLKLKKKAVELQKPTFSGMKVNPFERVTMKSVKSAGYIKTFSPRSHDLDSLVSDISGCDRFDNRFSKK